MNVSERNNERIYPDGTRRRSFIPVLLFSLVGFYVTIFPLVRQPSLYAQGWQMYADEIRREAAEKRNFRDRKKKAPEATSPASGAESPDNSSIEPIGRPSLDSGPITPHPPTDVTDLPEESSEDPVPSLSFAPAPPSYRDLPRMRNDATINDLFFPSSAQGWGVGDRGTIWTTLNGGESWLLVQSPTDVNLHAVHFADPACGLIVGGSILPGNPNGRGVILRTEDGGRNWLPVEIPPFPILRAVRFLDRERVLAFGDSSELYPSGVFYSEDGGRTWSAKMDVNRHHGWTSATLLAGEGEAFPDEVSFLGVSPEGRLQVLSDSCRDIPVPSRGTERVLDLGRSDRDSSFWLVGDNGLVMTSVDGGNDWRRPEGELPSGAKFFDFQTVSIFGEKIRVAGNPGTVVFMSDDGGRTWDAAPTGVSVPIRKIRFLDDLHGWLVGELGTIAATDDGGRSWTVQREGGRRLAYLGLMADEMEIPYELIARLSADDGFLGRMTVILSHESDGVDEIADSLRLAEGVVEAGGNGAEIFPTFHAPCDGLSLSMERWVERFRRENDGRGLESLREWLVRRIRTYRPEVLFLSDPTLPIEPELSSPALLSRGPVRNDKGWDFPTSERISFASNEGISSPDSIRPVAHRQKSTRLDPVKLALMTEFNRQTEPPPVDPVRQLIAREVLEAVRMAADPLAFPDHLTQCALPVWKVKRVFKVLNRGNGPEDLLVKTTGGVSRLGRSDSEIGTRARRRVGFSPEKTGDFPSVNESVRLAILYDSGESGKTGREDSPFPGETVPFGSESRRHAPMGGLPNGEEWERRDKERRRLLGLAEHLTSDPGQNGAAEIFAPLESTSIPLDPELTIDYLLTAGHSFVRAGEWEDAEEIFSKIALDYPSEPDSREALRWLIQYYSGSEPHRRSDDRPESDAIRSERWENASTLADLIRDLWPELFMDPRVRFPVASIQRRKGDLEGVLRYFRNRSRLVGEDVTGLQAKGELWLLSPETKGAASDSPAPLPTHSARKTSARPFLDGVLEPEVWDQADRFPLSNGDGGEGDVSTVLGTFLSILYDDEFLYLAIDARKSPHFPYVTSGDGGADGIRPPRQRDADLTGLDRMEIALDPDRDGVTAYRFDLDWRGWVTDSCWRQTSWDSPLYLADREETDCWFLEVAIPWSHLTGLCPETGDVWRVSFRRVVPDVGEESWSGEGDGYLSFGRDR